MPYFKFNQNTRDAFLMVAYNVTACRSPGFECQERAAVNWLTFISNQFTAAPA
jgi:hypothetical protein